MLLREYQQELINNIRNEIKKGKKSIVAVLGCGGGKSVILGNIASRTTSKGNRVLFLVHRKELLEQIKATFKRCGVDMRLCDVVGTHTYTRNKTKYKKPNLILIDETHTNLKIYQRLFDENPEAIKIGFTATPTRLKEGGLGMLFESLVQSVNVQWLINNSYLSDFSYHTVPLIETKNISISKGDFDTIELNDIMENRIIYKNSFKEWQRLAEGRKTMIFCTSLKASLETIEEFKRHGVRAEHIDGTMPKKKREELIAKYRSGKILVLSNVMLFSEGYDDPDIECVLLLRPTMSLALHTQQAMRCMRYKPNKRAIIIDCVGNYYRHGTPSDEVEWSLEQNKKRRKNQDEDTLKIKMCPSCLGNIPTIMKVCSICGYEFNELDITKDKKIVMEELVEVERIEQLKKTNTNDFNGTTWEEIEEFRKLKKFKFMWSLYYAHNHGIKIPKQYLGLVKKFILKEG